MTSLNNLITFHIPVYVMNLGAVQPGSVIRAAFSLSVGNNYIWTGIKSFSIWYAATPYSVTDPSVLQVDPLFNSTGISVGGSASFLITLDVQSGWANFSIKVVGMAGKSGKDQNPEMGVHERCHFWVQVSNQLWPVLMTEVDLGTFHPGTL